MISNFDDLIILWLSDIHYSPLKDEDSKLARKDFIDSFLEEIEDIFTKKERIDYVILSGDIALRGEDSDYKVFWDEILVPLHELILSKKLQFPKILTIPGNHDLDWAESKFLMEFFQKGLTGKEKDDFLSNNEPKFRLLFGPYSNTFSSKGIHISTPVWQDFFNLDGHNAGSRPKDKNPYPDHRLYGYVLDANRDLLFIMLNTAWYSLGSKLDEIISTHFLGSTKYTTPPSELINDILKMKDTVTEYNGQIYGIGLLSKLGLRTLIGQNPGLLIITCMHHPKNWMAWNEIYNDQRDTLISNFILDHSDILLTGHEHVPDNVKPEFIEETIHFKGGMFMNDPKSGYSPPFESNRFSLLQITNRFNSPRVTEWRYLYEPSKKWIKNIGEDLHLSRSTRQHNHLNTNLAPLLARFSIRDYLTEKKIASEAPLIPEHVQEGELTIGSLKCQYLLTGTGSLNTIYIFPTDPGYPFYETLTKDPNSLVIALESQPDIGRLVDHFSFLVPDRIVSKTLYEKYDGNNSNSNFTDLTKYADILFDWFRHSFFEYFAKTTRFKDIRDIRFLNTVISYWMVEKHARV